MRRTSSRERRRHTRQPMNEPVTLHWEEAGNTFCARACCVDISTSGARVEAESLYRPFPSQTKIRFQIESLKLAGTAIVRHSVRRSRKMIIGLEFCGGLCFKPSTQNVESGELVAVE